MNSSLDQYMAVERKLGAATRVTSIAVGVGDDSTAAGTTLSFGPGGAALPKVIDPVQAFDLEGAPLGLAVGSGLRAFLDVPARAERLVAGPGEHHARHAPVRPGVLERTDQLVDGAPPERVVAFGPVDPHDRDGVVPAYLVDDVGELLDLHLCSLKRHIS